MSLLAKAFRSPRRLGPCLQQARRLRMGGLRGYDKKERVEEELYVKKEEEKAMRKLLAKVKAQAEAAEPAAAAEARQEEIAALKPIIDKYKMSAHDVEFLLAWRSNPDF